MNILFLARETPFPADSGVKMRAWLVLKHLAQRHQVTLICYGGTSAAANELARLCKTVRQIEDAPTKSSSKICPKMLCGLFSRIPYAIRARFSKKYAAAVKALLQAEMFDLIVCDSLYQASYIPADRKILLNEHNIESTIIERYMNIEKNAFKRWYASYEWRRMKVFEETIWKRCDLIFACSQVDKEEMEKRTGARNVEVVANGVDLPAQPAGPGKPFDLVYTGLIGWRPNEDAVLFFAQEIYPLIKKSCPQVRFSIVGKGPSPLVKSLEKEGSITVTGAVADVKPYLEGGAVIVVPLRIGSGTRLKILEAFALGKAVVSTTIGCEGLEVTHGKDILIADGPQEFAQAVLKLLEDPAARKMLGEAGRRLVEEKYSYEVIGQTIETAIKQL